VKHEKFRRCRNSGIIGKAAAKPQALSPQKNRKLLTDFIRKTELHPQPAPTFPLSQRT
jgi:hypothetical protein